VPSVLQHIGDYMISLQKLISGGALSIAIAIAGSAQAVNLPYRTFVGSLNNFNSFGELGFVHSTAKDGHPSDGNFGAAFDNVVTVNSITIDQRVDPGRHRMRDLRIYTSPGNFTTASLADAQGPQTITLPGAGLTSDYFFITVESSYTTGANDDNPGLHGFTFDGTVGAARTNLNSLLLPTVTNYFDDPPGTFFTDVVSNGQIVSTTGGPVDGLYFEHSDTTDRSIAFTYGSPQTVASIGLSFESQIVSSYNTRPVPKFVTLSDSNGNSQQITLAQHTLQYGQYNLTTPFTNTTSLKVTLPVGAANYYPSQIFDANQPQSSLTGVNEFQAFATGIVSPPTALVGDYNADGKVNAADYVIWRNDPASFGNAQGYTDWRSHFGQGSGSGSGSGAAAVPEPQSIALIACSIATCIGFGRRRSCVR
jgi:hypothetical protein